MSSIELEHVEKQPSSTFDPKRMTLKGTDLILHLKAIPGHMFIESGDEMELQGTAKLKHHESWDEYTQFTNHMINVNVEV